MFHIDLRQFELKVTVGDGQTLLDCIRQTGIDIISPCGGKGLCGKCLVHIYKDGNNIPEIKPACQTLVESNLAVEIPEQSLFVSPEILLESSIKTSLVQSGKSMTKSSSDKSLLGIALDVGTTTIAGYLIDLGTGNTLAAGGISNPQIPYGDEVITRLGFAHESTDNTLLLRQKTTEALDMLINRLCRTSDPAQPYRISEIIIVCNTAMHHILTNADIRQLVHAPFTPSVNQDMIVSVHDLGIAAAGEAQVILPSPVAGFIGSDHAAMLLAIGALKTSGPILAVDIGTNTEISLVTDHSILSASCASGGAFEGTSISCGMPAAAGAIDHIQIEGSELEYHTIGGVEPLGVCGSGIFDALAQMIANGIVDHTGKIQPVHPLIRKGQNGLEFIVVHQKDHDTEKLITITQQDVRALQLAKAAIYTGISILLREAGLNEYDLREIVVAGAFGSYLDISSAITTGLLPKLPHDRFHQVGNAAGIGAKNYLLYPDARQQMKQIRESIRHIELVNIPDFQKIYLSALSL